MIIRSFIKTLLFIFCLLFLFSAYSQEIIPDHVEPPFWWTGMNHSGLQLLVHGKDIASTEASLVYDGVTLLRTNRTGNPNYLFLDLAIEAKASPGEFTIEFHKDGALMARYQYRLYGRHPGSSQRKGFDASDVIYLVMPDRFANGDTTNDSVAGMLEKADRNDPNGRHGGDMKGISDHLDYIKDLGVTALWLNPFLENNNPRFSYHGYAITDFYKTDPRLGTNTDYLKLVDSCHSLGIKVIMDMVFNHCSTYHWFIQDLPSYDWIHQFSQYTPSNFRASTLMDSHASEYDRTKMLTGWFDRHMADLNQKNIFLTTYLIQNSIWWIEYAGLDGIRLDTQPYVYKDMIAQWGQRIKEEYPDFTIVGEAWLQDESMTAYFQEDAHNSDGYNSFIPGVTDFPLYYALSVVFNEEESYSTGMAKLYDVIAQDFLYAHPNRNLVFADNHDLTRFFTSVNEDLDKYRMGMTYILTTRGIPVIYYGTEILMTGHAEKGHGTIRTDFPGGWPGDPKNAFTAAGRTEQQNQAFNFIRKLITWRDAKPMIHDGYLKHFVPDDGIYTYFRYNNTGTVMVIMNNTMEQKTVSTGNYSECMGDYSSGYDVTGGNRIEELNTIDVPAKTARIIELKK
jgi:glycosidase